MACRIGFGDSQGASDQDRQVFINIESLAVGHVAGRVTRGMLNVENLMRCLAKVVDDTNGCCTLALISDTVQI